MTSQREEFERAFPCPTTAFWVDVADMYVPFEQSAAYVLAAGIQQARWEAWQAATRNQSDELNRLKLDIAEALRAVTTNPR